VRVFLFLFLVFFTFSCPSKQINALVRYDCLRIFGMAPSRLHPNSVRGLFGLRASRAAADNTTTTPRANDNIVAATEGSATGKQKPKAAGNKLAIKMAVFDFVHHHVFESHV
jgi:hypothetical protein